MALTTSTTGAGDVGSLTPARARARFRDGLVTTTAGWSRGWTQANLVAVPRLGASYSSRRPRSRRIAETCSTSVTR